MRYGNLVWAIPATLAIAGVWGVSACANWFFGASLGDDTAAIGNITTAELFSGVSLASDMLKAVMLFGMTWALATRKWVAALVLASIWTVCAAWSVFSAVGFVALNNGTVTDRRGKSADEWTQLRDEIERTQERRKWVPKHRPVDTVRAELDGIEADFIFVRAKRCTDVTTPESTTLCKRFADLKQELGNASAAASLDGKLATLRAELKTTDRVTSANPFAEMVGALIGSHAANVTTGQALFLALMLELISGPGLWAVWSSALAPARKPKEAPKQEEAISTTPIVSRQPEITVEAFVKPIEPEPVSPLPPPTKPSPKEEKAEPVIEAPKYPVLVDENFAKKKSVLPKSIAKWRKSFLIEDTAKLSDGSYRHVVKGSDAWAHYSSLPGLSEVKSQSGFGKKLSKLGVRKESRVDGVYYVGVRLMRQEEAKVA